MSIVVSMGYCIEVVGEEGQGVISCIFRELHVAAPNLMSDQPANFKRQLMCPAKNSLLLLLELYRYHNKAPFLPRNHRPWPY